MYRPGEQPHHPPPFRPRPPPHGAHGGPLFGHSAPFGPSRGAPPPGRFLHAPRSYPAPRPEFHRSPPARGHFILPHCSSFSVDPPAERSNLPMPKWKPITNEHHPTDSSEDAGEEFLRCIAANKPLPSYLKGNMAYNMADALKSADILKEAVKLEPDFQKHPTKSRRQSRSRSLSRSLSPSWRGSWAKSRAKSRVRSRSRGRGRSRERSRSRERGRSRGRSHSRSRGRSRGRSRAKSRAKSVHRVRSRSRARSRSQSLTKNRARSKSRARKSRSRSCNSEKRHGKISPVQSSGGIVDSSLHPQAKSLLDELKMVINSKELDDRMPSLKDAILNIQASAKSKQMDCEPSRQQRSPENNEPLENEMVLPHDRVSMDFSWLQTPSGGQSNTHLQHQVDHEELFLYGTEDGKYTHRSQCKDMERSVVSQKHYQPPAYGSFGDSLSVVAASLDSNECEKIKSVLKTMGSTDIGDIMLKAQGQMEGSQPLPVLLTAVDAPDNTNVRQALESLIKATKEKRVQSRLPDSGSSRISPDKHKVADEGRANEIQAKKRKMETLMEELETLLKEDGMSFLTPVIGFFCQKCAEFIGDLSAAESHSAMHQRTERCSKQVTDSNGGGGTRHPHGNHRNAGDALNHRDQQHARKDEKDLRDNQDDGPLKFSLREEMRTERMLITVSHDVAPPPNTKKEHDHKMEHITGRHSRVKSEKTDGKKKSSRDDRGRDSSSNSSSDDGKNIRLKVKSPKMKKKKKKKKKAKS